MSQSLKGFRDFYPEAMAARSYLFGAWRSVARRFGFEEYDGPPLEALELYTRKSGEEIVSQLYHFQDKGGRDVALRPEMTPTLARMMAERASSLPKPIKWFSIPQLFRYERSQRGRLREHFQLNVDIVGASEVEADVELLAVALEVQKELGLTREDVIARVNDRRIVAGVLSLIGVPAESGAAAYSAIDKFRKVPHETFAELLSRAGVPQARADELTGLCAGTIAIGDWFREHAHEDVGVGDDVIVGAARRAVHDLEHYLSRMNERGLGELVEVDFSIVRGLAYYTGIVFELYDRKGKERAICGGGRYDDLVASLGGPDIPALGFGMGDVVLTLMLRDRGLVPEPPPRVDVVVIPVGAELVGAARGLVDELRRAGIRAETPFTPAGVGKDLKTASRDRARYAVIVGPDEWTAGDVNVKDLATGEQERVPRDALASKVRATHKSSERR